MKSEIKHRIYGFIKAVINHERRKFDFTEYLEPVDFPAYYDESRKLMLFQAPKKVCKGVLANLREKPCGVDLVEMEVDFGKGNSPFCARGRRQGKGEGLSFRASRSGGL